MTLLSDRRFSQRSGRAIGGGASSGPFQNVPFQMMHPNYVMYWNDFTTPADYDAGVEWTVTDRAAGGGGIAFATNTGTELILSVTTDTQGFQTQLTGAGAGEFIVPGQAGGHFACGVRLKKDDSDLGFAYGGLGQTFTTLVEAAGNLHTDTRGIFFAVREGNITVYLDGTTSVESPYGDIRSGGAGSSTASYTLPDDTYIDLALSATNITSTGVGEISVWYKIIGERSWTRDAFATAAVAAGTTVITTANICPSLSFVAGAATSTMTVDYLWAISERVATT